MAIFALYVVGPFAADEAPLTAQAMSASSSRSRS